MADLAPDREGFLEEGEHRILWEYVGKGDKEAVCLLNGLAMHIEKVHAVGVSYGGFVAALPVVLLFLALLDPESSAPYGLSRSSAALMLCHEVRVDLREPVERPGRASGREGIWGLGWTLNTTAGGEIVHHGGANSTGFRSFSQFSPGRA